MAKKMSIEEMLAAARAEKAGGKKPPAPADKPAADAPAEESSAPAAAAPGAPPAKVAPGGKGMSMADILAAARASKAGAAPAAPAAEKPKPAEKPAPKPAAAAAEKKPAAAAAGPVEKDTASILAAARNKSKAGPMSKSEAAAKGVEIPPAGKQKIAVPPMPARPAFRQQPAAGAETSRRSFLAGMTVLGSFLFGSGLAVGFTTLAATSLAALLGTARFMFPNILIEPPTQFKVGFPDNLGPGQVESKFIPQFGVWIVRYEFDGQPMIYALKAVCTHLGCTPNWLEGEQKFKCPCHGSGFYKDGVNFEGPAPRPLERYAISLADDGQLQVDKSRTFNQELGQWKDPSSYVSV